MNDVPTGTVTSLDLIRDVLLDSMLYASSRIIVASEAALSWSISFAHANTYLVKTYYSV